MNYPLPASSSDQSDVFDGVPDAIISLIFNKISDVKTLIRCRSVSKRLNSLVPQSDSVLLRVDRVISTADSEGDDGDSVFANFLRSILKSFHCFISPNKQRLLSNSTRPQNSPAQILRGFESIRSLQIQLPSGDLKLDKGSSIQWKAYFGKTLRSCVILGFRGGAEAEFGGSELKLRVIWTISALISASARHYMMSDVMSEQKSLTELIVTDKDDEGTLVMDKVGLKEFRLRDSEDEEINNNSNNSSSNGGMDIWLKSNRTPVPGVRMRVKHESKTELSNGVMMEGATLIIIRPKSGYVSVAAGVGSEVEEHGGDVALAMKAFGGDGIYREVIEKLLKSKTYVLEMNSF